MRKKSWLIGATALAAVAAFGAFGIHSVKATETESESAKEQIIFEQVGRDTYSSCAYGENGMMLGAEDNKYYTKVDNDGTMTELDNSDGKYKTIAVSSSCDYVNSILSIDEDKNGAVLNYDGSFAYGTDNYYEYVTGLRVDGQSVCAYEEDGKVVVNNVNGDKLFEVSIPDNNYGGLTIRSCVKYISIAYKVDNDYKYQYLYYDLNGNEVTYSDVHEYMSVNYDAVYNTSGRVFTKVSGREFDNGYRASFEGVLKGQKVYYAYRSSDRSRAIIDEEGNELLLDVNSSYAAFGDKIATRTYKDPDNTKAGSEYHIVKAVLATELKKDDANNSVAEIVAEDAALGSDVTYDDLDADAKSVYDKKFNFNVKAANGVIADGASLSVTKVVAGSDYEAAKEATKEAASHIAVFNIDLLRDGAKIQPNGNIEFTVDVPDNFNSDLLAVYRLSSDGTSYVKLTSSVKDGKVTFVTDHFSTYIIAEEKQAVVPDDNNNNAGNEDNNANNNNNASNNEDSNTNNSSTAANNEQASGSEVSSTVPTTGDTANYIIYIVAVLCAAAAGVCAMTFKKRAK